MTSPDSFSMPEVTPEMRDHTRYLREMEAPEDFTFLGNFAIIPLYESIPPASKIIKNQEKRYGEENVFTTSLAYNEDGSASEGSVALYRRESAELIPLKTRLIRKLGSLSLR